MSSRSFSLLLVVVLGAASAPAQPKVRFFFDRQGAAEQEDRGIGDLFFENPVADGSERLYLYGQFLSRVVSTWQTIGLDIEVSGGGVITSWSIYNHTMATGFARWTGISKKDGVGPITKLDDVLMGAILNFNFGLQLKHAETVDVKHFRNQQEDGVGAYGNTLLGYIDVSSNGEPYSEVRLGVGTNGIWSLEGGVTPKEIAFGFGDEDAGIWSNSYGMQSPIADATITPEPATLLLLIGAGSAVASTRRR
ncbi:MAG: hypothetical protein CHACPFDD_01367 [Phycisphaerae bacterium]|nr:hypothetical protein [Phycisphaerae bacterium]